MFLYNKKPKVLVLEAVWEPDDLGDRTSVRGFMTAWADELEVRVTFRPYNDRKDLVRWLREFLVTKGDPYIVYVAGHGDGRMLDGLHGNMHLPSILAAATKGIPVPKERYARKGLLLGCCEVGAHLPELVRASNGRFGWIAGYRNEMPWFEGTISDLVFLEYMVRGRRITTKEGFVEAENTQHYRGSNRAELVAKWVREDYRLSVNCGFRAIDAAPVKTGPRRSRVRR